MTAEAGGWTWDRPFDMAADRAVDRGALDDAIKLSPPYHLITLDETDSTNAHAIRLAQAGASDGTVVWAKNQTAGRGSRGREWRSLDGNLYCTFLFRPTCHPQSALQLGFVAANAVADTIAACLPPSADVTCKWPNDILVEGKKIAGILLESALMDNDKLEWLVIGVGINVAHFPDDCEFRATSLSAEHPRNAGHVTLDSLVQSLCDRLRAGIVTWARLGFGPIRRTWLGRAYHLGGEITVRLGNDKALEGTFTDLDPDGVLVLEMENGVRKSITAGDVFPVMQDMGEKT